MILVNMWRQRVLLREMVIRGSHLSGAATVSSGSSKKRPLKRGIYAVLLM